MTTPLASILAPLAPLAQATEDSTSVVRLVPVLAGLVVATAVLLFLVAIVRRRLKADEGVARDFTLSDLRRLRAEGKMTDEELERAKTLLVGRVHSKLSKDATPPADPMNVEPKR